MGQFYRYLLKVFIVAFLFLEICSFGLLYKFKGSTFYKNNLPHQWEGKNFDFVILGSSRGLTSFDTQRLSNSLRQNGFNFSVDDTHIGSQLLMLEHLLYYGVTFDTLYLVYDAETVVNVKMATNDYRFFPYINNGYPLEYYRTRECPVNFDIARFLPFLALGYYNVELLVPSLYSIFDRNYRYRYDSFGDYSYPAKSFNLDTPARKVNINFGNEDLTTIRQLCAANGITLHLLILPAFNTTFEVPAHNGDFQMTNLSQDLKQKEYFYDQLHVNSFGKEILTDLLIQKLNSK